MITDQGEEIRNRINNLGLKQIAIARSLCISGGHLNQILNGERPVNKYIAKINLIIEEYEKALLIIKQKIQ